ncbi:MAG: DUF2796 domain-containing protein [Desulfovibrio sp.]|nr:DUF2796 domain-containing protein [Desulfovibrio sp.]
MKYLTALFLMLWALPAFAHEAHVHGLAHLTLVLEDSGGELSLFSAQANFLPFEHAAQTTEEKQAAAALIRQLQEPEELFALSPEAQCRMQVIDLKAPSLEAGHVHAGHDHANIHLSVALSCQAPEKLHELSLPLMAKFPALREVEVEMAGPRGQSSAHLKRDNAVFRW